MPADNKLTAQDIIDQLSADRQKGFVDRLAATLKQQGCELKNVVDLTFYPDKQIAFRAAWLLDTMVLTDPEYYLTSLPYLIGKIKEVTNESCKRHYTRIMLNLTDKKAAEPIKAMLREIEMDDVIEQFFDWIIDPKVKAAVKIFAADTLYNLSGRYDWINEELANQVEFMMRNGSAAIQLRGKKLLALIQK